MKDSNKTSVLSSKDFEIESKSWEQIYSLLLKLADTIRKSGFEHDMIVAVSRGGWIPARILADLLGTSELTDVKVEFYVGIGETQHRPNITQPILRSVRNQRILIVDDLADTGESLKLVKKHLKNQGALEVRIATIYCKPESIIIPNYYDEETRKWIVFPWELKETVRKTIEKIVDEGRTVDDAKEKLINSGLDSNLTKRFIKEIVSELH